MSTTDVTLPAGYRLSVHAELDSTNSEALRRASAGEEGGLWVWAQSQTSGRGRLGRRWDSLAGNLFATLLLRPDCEPAQMAQLSLVAGVALHDGVSRLAPRDIAAHLMLKWPNDLLYDEMKFAGVLLENKAVDGGGSAVAIGIGVNLAVHPELTDCRATNLSRQGVSATPARALECLAAASKEWIDIWNNGSGFAHIRKAWMERSLSANAPLQVRLTGTVARGLYGGLDEDGALLLILEDGTKKRVTTGDVFPL